MLSPQVAMAMPVRDWFAAVVPDLDAMRFMGKSRGTDRLVSGGIPAQVVQTFVESAPDEPMDQSVRLIIELSLMAASHMPDMSVETAFGYVFAAGPDRRFIADALAADWASAGLVDDGWLYAAAGISVAECLAGRRVPKSTLLAMAALRGVLIPDV